jgi:putative transposase
VHPVKLVTDNGPAFKAIGFARFIDSRPELVHIRTRRKSPHTNGVRERAFGSLKYEHLYREEITDGVMLPTRPSTTGRSSTPSDPTKPWT